MSNSYRIRTQIGVDKSVKIQLDQDFEFLEILSLKLVQSQVYSRPCSDYGVVVGRVSVNDGFGLPNCKVSIFIPLTQSDSLNPIISDLYPYTSLSDLNEDGYRYNLLPYTKSYSVHQPTGTFFTRNDVLVNPTLFEVYEKYFKYTAVTNESGDFMIFGVPVGSQTIHLDVDLSDIGEFSLSPQDLIRIGRATENQISGVNFKTSTNLDSLPQIISINKVIQVEPLWGQPNICNLGITRTDFDLSSEAQITIQPTAIFMGSIISDSERSALRQNCKPKLNQGELCNLITGPGEILAIRQTIFQDEYGRPILETFDLGQGGQVIDENGTWVLDVPMNLDYVITNEFGEQVFSNDPKKGIPTKAKYRFKIKWNQSPSMSENIKRGYYLVPNIKEYGWDGNNLTNFSQRSESYAFSLDWNEYGNTGTTVGLEMIQEAIDCKDRFYPMLYNKVYTVSQIIDQYRNGRIPNRNIGVKNILDDTCETENYRFPTNDAAFRLDIIYLLYTLGILIFKPLLYTIIVAAHILKGLSFVLGTLLTVLGGGLIAYGIIQLTTSPSFIFGAPGMAAQGASQIALGAVILGLGVGAFLIKVKNIKLPTMLYDSCEFCSCKDPNDVTDGDLQQPSATDTFQPLISNQSGGQIPLLDAGPYNQNEFNNDDKSWISISNVMGGQGVSQPNICGTKVPGLVTGSWSIVDNNGDSTDFKYQFFSTSLTLAERINLFNTKAKYFNQGTESPIGSGVYTNPGGGVNQIQVKVEPLSNPFVSHTDNIIFMMLTPNSLGSMTTGSIITFQDPNLSFDINYTGGTSNIYGNNAISGTSKNINPFSITLPYIKPDGTQSSVTYFNITGSTGDTNFHKFPTDIEYFQVITAMTYSTFSGLCTTSLPNSLNERYLNNDMTILQIKRNSPDINSHNIINSSPLSILNDHENMTCVMLVRGVDPYSSRVNVEYDLSKIFGYNSFGSIKVSGQYKLNYPINGGGSSNGFFNVRHNLTNCDDFDTISGMFLYNETFNYQPNNIQFSGFTSKLPKFYSKLDGTFTNTTTPLPNSICQNCDIPSDLFTPDNGFIDSSYGLTIHNSPLIFPFTPPPYERRYNAMLFEWNQQQTISPLSYSPTINLITNGQNRGYFPYEPVEGGSAMLIEAKIPYYNGSDKAPEIKTRYISPIYLSTYQLTYPNTLVSNTKLVMRSDRLPSSTQGYPNCDNYYLLQSNTSLGIFKIPDEGTLSISSQNTGGFSLNSDTTSADTPNFTAQILNSMNNCQNSVPLTCYESKDYNFYQHEVGLKNPDDCQKYKGQYVWERGCYVLVTQAFISLSKDLELLTEWFARFNVTFAACRNVFSHSFTNNWINGVLYNFAFKNNRIFDDQNNPTSEFCNDVIYLDTINNNFYYRSSPYDASTNTFVGRPTTGIYSVNGPNNQYNLLFPTTIMDLGPRSFYLQEIFMSDDYDGYVIKDIQSTTFKDVQGLFNIFILNRLVNQGLLEQILLPEIYSISEYFSRNKSLTNQTRFVDGDYAQMISINSELGINEFDAINYPEVPDALLPYIPIIPPPPPYPNPTSYNYFTPYPTTYRQDPIYFNGIKDADGIFGVFFSSNTQIRDFITPKRTIIVDDVAPPPINYCAFSNFNVFSQVVPFYQWEIKPNEGSEDSIFGSQKNDWYTNNDIPFNGSFFNKTYQSLDRIQQSSRYFRSIGGDTEVRIFRGFIYSESYDPTNLVWNYEPRVSSSHDNTPFSRIITHGSPFHFYFGLKRNKSAWDRFAKKWIGFQTITE